MHIYSFFYFISIWILIVKQCHPRIRSTLSKSKWCILLIIHVLSIFYYFLLLFIQSELKRTVKNTHSLIENLKGLRSSENENSPKLLTEIKTNLKSISWDIQDLQETISNIPKQTKENNNLNKITFLLKTSLPKILLSSIWVTVNFKAEKSL